MYYTSMDIQYRNGPIRDSPHPTPCLHPQAHCCRRPGWGRVRSGGVIYQNIGVYIYIPIAITTYQGDNYILCWISLVAYCLLAIW